MVGNKDNFNSANRPKTKYAMAGGIICILFGLTLSVIGARLVFYQHFLEVRGQKVIGKITDTGTVRHSSGGYVNYIRYSFNDNSGKMHNGQSSGYSGKIGETILLEYSPDFPFIHRVSGEGRNKGYQWRWFILGAGLLFSIAGIHWFLHTRARIRLCVRLSMEGILTKGIVLQITDSGRTITYQYTTDSGSFRGKTMALPVKLVQQHKENDQVEVLYDPEYHQRSVLKIEL